MKPIEELCGGVCVSLEMLKFAEIRIAWDLLSCESERGEKLKTSKAKII